MLSLDRVFEFVDKQKVAIVSSVDGEGFPNTKAMLAPRRRDGGVFYFSTNTSSMRVTQFREDPKACLYFFHKGRFRYEGVMLIGTVEVLEDPEIKEDIWRDGDTMFYKLGVTDPDYCVLRFTAVKGRHYADLHSESFDLEGAGRQRG